jgi:hypothetical protein
MSRTMIVVLDPASHRDVGPPIKRRGQLSPYRVPEPGAARPLEEDEDLQQRLVAATSGQSPSRRWPKGAIRA